jgi:NO-binding membrane sensor protein with MHYT domain
VSSSLHLALCAVCFGLVSIWCMHFVGNKSIILGDGSPEIQLYYSAGWTTLSAILPILVLYGAFFLTDLLNKSPRAMYLALAATGVLAGLAVTGMHYIGNLGTSNYVLDNNYAHILGAASIAIVACWFSFTVFFHQKEHWINFWWRRFLCAILLAAAVSGMHWTASVGTEYRLKAYHTGNSDERNINVILAAVLVSPITCAFLLEKYLQFTL